jgi:hypothetical protein
MQKVFYIWRSFGEEKGEEGLHGRRRKEAGGVPGGTGKTNVWLVTAMTTKMRWLQWCAQEANEGGGKKLGKCCFFPTLASDFLMLNASNSPLFIRSGRGYCFFTDVKSWLLIQPGRILTVGSKLLSRPKKVGS